MRPQEYDRDDRGAFLLDEDVVVVQGNPQYPPPESSTRNAFAAEPEEPETRVEDLAPAPVASELLARAINDEHGAYFRASAQVFDVAPQAHPYDCRSERTRCAVMCLKPARDVAGLDEP